MITVIYSVLSLVFFWHFWPTSILSLCLSITAFVFGYVIARYIDLAIFAIEREI